MQLERRQRRVELYEKAVKLHGEGHSQKAIAQALQIQRKTVRRWLRAGQFPERKARASQPSKVQEFAEYLRRRWSDGCHNATTLSQEIRSRGYRGQRGMVARFVSGWRATRPDSTSNRRQRITPRQVAVLTNRDPVQITPQQQTVLDQLYSTCPDLKCMRTLATDFRAALSSKDGNQMRNWLRTAKQSGIGSVVRFAFGLQRDLFAVSAAVESPWSNGQVEGQNNPPQDAQETNVWARQPATPAC